MKIADRPNNADPLSNSYKRQNIYSLKKNFNQQKLDEFLSKNDNEESVNFANKLNFLKRDENERKKPMPRIIKNSCETTLFEQLLANYKYNSNIMKKRDAL